MNVGGPIAQTPAQALETLRRAKAMTGLVMVTDEGFSRIAYHNVDEAPKDAGRQLRSWLNSYHETEVVVMDSISESGATQSV